MKALTICQPYAHLICVTRSKRVENRTWPTRYRGPILIHAGKSRAWLDVDVDRETGVEFDRSHEVALSEMAFGAVVGAAILIDCLHIDTIRAGQHDKRLPWLRGHEHTGGPWCWLLGQRRAFPSPVAFQGSQGLFDIPESIVAEQMALLREAGARYGKAAP